MNLLEIATRIARADIAKAEKHRKNYIFGAVCIRQDGSMAVSTNILTQTPNPAAHAERRVLAKSGYGAILYVVRIKRDGSWAMAKPCKSCETFIKNMKVKKVTYSVEPNRYEVWRPSK